jgi:hypothetical protein
MNVVYIAAIAATETTVEFHFPLLMMLMMVLPVWFVRLEARLQASERHRNAKYQAKRVFESHSSRIH